MKVKGYNCIMIECSDKPVTLHSLVGISPCDSTTGRWMMGLTIVTTLEDALEYEEKKCSQDVDVQDFLERYYENIGVDKNG